MAFWTDASFEPKMNYRWRVEFDIPSVNAVQGGPAIQFLKEGIPSFYAKSVTKPSFALNTKKYRLVNREQVFPGDITWNPVSISFIDTTDSVVTKFLIGYYSELGDEDRNGFSGTDFSTINKTGFDFISTTNKTSLNRLNLKIYHLDSEGRGNSTDAEGEYAKIEIWQLTNPIIKSYSSSGLSYSNGDLSEYTLEIEYDWAFLERD